MGPRAGTMVHTSSTSIRFVRLMVGGMEIFQSDSQESLCCCLGFSALHSRRHVLHGLRPATLVCPRGSPVTCKIQRSAGRCFTNGTHRARNQKKKKKKKILGLNPVYTKKKKKKKKKK